MSKMGEYYEEQKTKGNWDEADAYYDEQAEKLETYCGIADCHGIESFTLEKDANISMLSIRAASNPQRAATVYKVTLNTKQIKAIKNYLENDNYMNALRCLQSMSRGDSKDLGKLKELEVDNPKYWKMIPNPRLDTFDPYHQKQ
jgi:hypothetical protein